MKKADLTNAVLELVKEEGLDLTKKDLTVIIDKTFEAVQNGLVDGEEVPVGVLGKFITSVRAARKGRNPADGTEIDIPETTVAKFKPSKNLKESLKG